MPDVVEIILELLDRVFIALPIRIIHLRPSGDPRFHQVPKMIKRNYLLVAFCALSPFRAWADQAHVTLEDIPELGHLIEPQSPQPTADTRHARITFARVEIGRLLSRLILVAHEHRAELICLKNVTFASDPRLPEDCRSTAFHPNQQENQREKWRENQKENG